MKHEGKETAMIEIAKLARNLFVRKSLDQDRVIQFDELLKSGTELDPIIVNRQGVLIDGRHRVEAYELNGMTHVRAIVLDIEDEVELIAEAYQANTGGAKPPTRADTEHTILSLVNRTVSQKRIGELLGLPASIARQYIRSVQSREARANLQRAREAVSEDRLTLREAAEEYRVEFEALKEAVSGRKKNRDDSSLENAQRELTKRYQSVAQSDPALLKKLMEQLEDGDVSDQQAEDILEHVRDLQVKARKRIEDWERRFEAMRVRTGDDGKDEPKSVVRPQPSRSGGALAKMGLVR